MRRYTGNRATVASGIRRPRLVVAIDVHDTSFVHAFTKYSHVAALPWTHEEARQLPGTSSLRISLPVAERGSSSTKMIFVGHL